MLGTLMDKTYFSLFIFLIKGVIMDVAELKRCLDGMDDECPVVFEHRQNGESANESFSVDKVEARYEFCMLVSVD